jgi:hypothetical protein
MHIKVLISAPSDQQEAAKAAVRALAQLNDILDVHGHRIETKCWKRNFSTGRAGRAQEVINDQIEDCHAVIAIFGARMGTPTGQHLSGSAEEVERFLSISADGGVRYDVHIFFNATTSVNPMSIDTEQLRLLQQFRKSLEDRGVYYYDFTSMSDLEQAVRKSINNLVVKGNVDLTRTVPTIDGLEDLGIEDAMEIGGQGFLDATATMEKITEVMHGTSTLVEEININSKSAPVTAASRARFMLDTCAALTSLRENLAPLVAELQDQMDQAYATLNVALTIAFEDSLGVSEADKWLALRAQVIESTDSITRFRDASIEGRNTISALPRMTKELNRAKRGTASVFDNLVTHLTRSIEKSEMLVAQIDRILRSNKE